MARFDFSGPAPGRYFLPLFASRACSAGRVKIIASRITPKVKLRLRLTHYFPLKFPLVICIESVVKGGPVFWDLLKRKEFYDSSGFIQPVDTA